MSNVVAFRPRTPACRLSAAHGGDAGQTTPDHDGRASPPGSAGDAGRPAACVATIDAIRRSASLRRAQAALPGSHPAPGRSEAEDVRPAAYDVDLVGYRLEEAGATLLALPDTGPSTRLRTSRLETVRDALHAYGWDGGRARPPVPSAEKIDRMDEALGWIPLIPQDRHVLRRIVGARCLVSPLTERHLYSWRRLGTLLGADHKAVQRWHGEGLTLIAAALNRREGCPA